MIDNKILESNNENTEKNPNLYIDNGESDLSATTEETKENVDMSEHQNGENNEQTEEDNSEKKIKQPDSKEIIVNGQTIKCWFNYKGLYTDEVFEQVKHIIFGDEWQLINVKVLDEVQYKLIVYQGRRDNKFLELFPFYDSKGKLVNYNYTIYHSYGRLILSKVDCFKEELLNK